MSYHMCVLIEQECAPKNVNQEQSNVLALNVLLRVCVLVLPGDTFCVQ